MLDDVIDKSTLLRGDVSESVTSLQQKTAEILAGQPKSSSRFYCDAFDDEEVNKVVRNVPPHVVTLIGFADFGKSTFVGSLYYYLMKFGRIAGYTFYDSDTFSGFERRTYIRNVKLNLQNRTLRTTVLEGYFLSLHLEKNNKPFELVLSDRSGETYEKAYTADGNKVQADKGLKSCKHLIFFIDASVFTDTQKRINFKGNFNKLLSRMKDARIFSCNVTIDLIFNKIDIVEGCDDDGLKEKFVAESSVFIENLESHVGQKINKVFKISSYQVQGNKPLEEVFEYLVDCCNTKKAYNPKVDWVTQLLKQ